MEFLIELIFRGQIGSYFIFKGPFKPKQLCEWCLLFSSVCVYLVLSEKEKTGLASGTPHIHGFSLL